MICITFITPRREAGAEKGKFGKYARHMCDSNGDKVNLPAWYFTHQYLIINFLAFVGVFTNKPKCRVYLQLNPVSLLSLNGVNTLRLPRSIAAGLLVIHKLFVFLRRE